MCFIIQKSSQGIFSDLGFDFTLLKSNKRASYCFMDTGRKSKTPLSEIKGFLTHITASSVSISAFLLISLGLPWWLSGIKSAFNAGASGDCFGFHPWVWKIPQRKAWQPLQCSCLGNPMDRGAWWAKIPQPSRVGQD